MEKQIYLDGRKLNLMFAIRNKIPMPVFRSLHDVRCGTAELDSLKKAPETAAWFTENANRITVVNSY